ncbi:ABC transporter family substrate-binding protein [Psychromicrobium lacuslunae]|uniref:ABC transporter substrate-binding protein n=1 Tax=Psychromicrobium lacuslunae TaxID=1618207 RepID=A0A0D4BYS7_9MICC|nr:ABC transporter family substrate-binding protein [Psychromicrobium lacuslunae]AJT41577.1 ABC transporter substrate-binding protein [Psychromicrobium lacuslunae]
MHFRRIVEAFGMTAIAVLALTACDGAPSNLPSPETTVAQGGSLSVAEGNSFTSFNPSTAHTNVDINAKISYATHSGFGYLDENLKVVRNEKFGKIEKLSDSPLTVKYTVNNGVKWSDDAPVDANDLVLAWVVASGYFDDRSESLGKGTNYFSFASGTSGLALSDFPEVGSDGRSITIKYSQPFADWETALGFPNISEPSHVVAQKAGLKDAAALIALFTSIPRGNPTAPVAPNAVLKKVADFWNNGFDATKLPTDTSLFLSNGPYIVKSVGSDQSITLVKNRDYDWGPEPHLDQIDVKYMPGSSEQTEALKAGNVSIIAPAASTDAINQIDSMVNSGVSLIKGEQLSYEHLDLNFSGVFADKDTRLAFLKTVPRAEIIDRLIGPLQSGAKPLDSQLFVPAQEKYADAVKANGSADFQQVDIEGAIKLLKGNKPTIRVLFDRNNPSRLDIFKQIADSAALAGIRLVDVSPAGADWSKSLGGSSYDAAIFSWSKEGVGVSDVPQIFKTGGPSNFNRFSDSKVDELMKTLITNSDAAKQDELKIQIDKLIWDDAYGLPLFQGIGLNAFSSKVQGIKYNPTPVGAWWNVWDWAKKA